MSLGRSALMLYRRKAFFCGAAAAMLCLATTVARAGLEIDSFNAFLDGVDRCGNLDPCKGSCTCFVGLVNTCTGCVTGTAQACVTCADVCLTRSGAGHRLNAEPFATLSFQLLGFHSLVRTTSR